MESSTSYMMLSVAPHFCLVGLAYRPNKVRAKYTGFFLLFTASSSRTALNGFRSYRAFSLHRRNDSIGHVPRI